MLVQGIRRRYTCPSRERSTRYGRTPVCWKGTGLAWRPAAFVAGVYVMVYCRSSQLRRPGDNRGATAAAMANQHLGRGHVLSQGETYRTGSKFSPAVSSSSFGCSLGAYCTVCVCRSFVHEHHCGKMNRVCVLST